MLQPKVSGNKFMMFCKQKRLDPNAAAPTVTASSGSTLFANT